MTWGREQGWAPKTVARRVTSLRAYGRWVGQPLLADYEPPSTPPSIPRPLRGGPESVAKMLEVAVGHSERCLVALCGRSGLRVSEARSVRPMDIFTDAGVNWIRIVGKGYKQREVPIPSDAWAVIEPVLAMRKAGEPLVWHSDSQARKAWATISERAGLGRSSTHSGRATVATDLLGRTGNLRLVQKVLGHASMSTTQVYTEVPRSAIADAMSG